MAGYSAGTEVQEYAGMYERKAEGVLSVVRALCLYYSSLVKLEKIPNDEVKIKIRLHKHR